MKITIITVCFNAEKTIKDTLESVLSQTYENYEYLIIDGKSNDNTLSIVQEYEKKFNGKLKWISEKDKGLFDAMNKGIRLSKGTVIGIINSDDILAHKNVFKTVIENIDDVDGVYSNLLMLDENLENPYRLFRSKKVSKKWGWHMPHPTLYLKKEVYEKYGNFDLDFKISADLDFMLMLIKNDVNLKYINDYLVYMRVGGTSTNGLKGYFNNFKESYKVLKKNKVLFPFLTNIKRTLGMYQQRFAIKRKKEIKRALNVKNQKPKLIQINTVCNGSTGKIMGDIQRKANAEGFDTLSIYARRKGYQDLRCIKVGGFFSFWFHVLITAVFDCHGHGSYFKTRKIVQILKKENPNIIHLHNIHGYYLNYKVLFKFLNNDFCGKIFWTFHDCWPFTGHCPHFTLAKCEKWKKQCFDCPNKTKYPTSFVLDRSHKNFLEKKELFTSLKNVTIITPSIWLEELVKQSYFKKYSIKTIHNGINLSIFKPTKNHNIREKYSIPNTKKILLGVASTWTKEKGLLDFYKLSCHISNDYIIALVGLNKKQLKNIKNYPNIIGIKRTENQIDLAILYTEAYCFLNLSYEDNYPTVNLESIACETPVISYNTGGCKEQVNEKLGFLSDYKSLLTNLKKIENFKVNNKDFIKEINKEVQCAKIIQLYNKE